ncbi:MAG: energy-coupling factor ABC transporter permease [Promethearchaeota archaeon]
MHIPDGILDLWLTLMMYGISGVYAAYCFKKTKNKLDDKMIPRVAIFTALVFAFQMLNFPVAGGTSGHLLGFVLLAIILGPEIGFISIMLVLIIQALIFADGGLLALGTNIFNMGIVPLIGYYIYLLIRNKSDDKKKIVLGAGIAAWIAVVVASIVAGIEIGISKAYPYGIEITVPAMMFWHVLIGIGEGLITAGVISLVLKTHPEFILNVENVSSQHQQVVSST